MSKMQLFYAPDIAPPSYTLNEEESKHCIRVLRLSCSDEVHITDGRGNMYRCRITDNNQRHCTVTVLETLSDYGKLPYRLTVGVAPTKNIDRFEWFLEKATEIGINEIIPLDTLHSERRTLKPEREQKVITAALKQSLKAYHPTLHPITPLGEVVAAAGGQRFIAHCAEPISAEGKRYLPDVLKKGGEITILIGPEGDFSDEEIKEAVDSGFCEITLGDQRLRTETAAVVAVAMVSTINSMER